MKVWKKLKTLISQQLYWSLARCTALPQPIPIEAVIRKKVEAWCKTR